MIVLKMMPAMPPHCLFNTSYCETLYLLLRNANVKQNRSHKIFSVIYMNICLAYSCVYNLASKIEPAFGTWTVSFEMQSKAKPLPKSRMSVKKYGTSGKACRKYLILTWEISHMNSVLNCQGATSQ